MNQINVNPSGVEPVDTSGDRSAAAGINLITVLIVLGVLAIIAWYLFTGPLRSMSSSSPPSNTGNPSQTTVNINPPSAPNPAQSGGNTSGSTDSTNPAPSKP